jgi:hypothetical protein
MYRGLAKLVGMDVLGPVRRRRQVETLRARTSTISSSFTSSVLTPRAGWRLPGEIAALEKVDTHIECCTRCRRSSWSPATTRRL